MKRIFWILSIFVPMRENPRSVKPRMNSEPEEDQYVSRSGFQLRIIGALVKNFERICRLLVYGASIFLLIASPVMGACPCQQPAGAINSSITGIPYPKPTFTLTPSPRAREQVTPTRAPSPIPTPSPAPTTAPPAPAKEFSFWGLISDFFQRIFSYLRSCLLQWR